MLQKSSISRTAETFFINPSKGQYLMDISRNVGLAHTSVKKNLKELAKLGIIRESIEKKGRRRYPVYKADINNKVFRRYKLVYNLLSILESGLVDFIEEALMPRSIVLFGSYPKGEDIETSDIDLFVESKKEELDIRSFEKKLGRKIELHFKEDFASYPKELKNNIINGVVLNGFLEAYK